MRLSFSLLLNIVTLMMLLVSSTLTQGRQFTFTSTRSSFNKIYFSKLALDITKGNLNAGMMIIKTLEPGFNIFIDFRLRLKNSKKYQSLFNYDVDICKLLDSVKSSIFKKWFLSFRKNGNFSEVCPVPPGYYYMQDWSMAQEHIPVYMQSGDYQLVTRFYYGRGKPKKVQMIMQAAINARLE